ncbi:outer membrane protein transport protein [Pseudomonas sp. MDMC_285]|nr:outer membrane protein transport protein [Pseudomonas sp. MDMC_285]
MQENNNDNALSALAIACGGRQFTGFARYAGAGIRLSLWFAVGGGAGFGACQRCRGRRPLDHFYNPAGLARLKGTQVTSGLSILLPDGKYEDKGSSDVFGNPVSGDAGEFLPDAAAPNFYFSHEINDRVTIGLGIFTPFGAKLDYKEDWAGRYGIQSASLETVTFNPSISYRSIRRSCVIRPFPMRTATGCRSVPTTR